jgi:hypothetical protein
MFHWHFDAAMKFVCNFTSLSDTISHTSGYKSGHEDTFRFIEIPLQMILRYLYIVLFNMFLKSALLFETYSRSSQLYANWLSYLSDIGEKEFSSQPKTSPRIKFQPHGTSGDEMCEQARCKSHRTHINSVWSTSVSLKVKDRAFLKPSLWIVCTMFSISLFTSFKSFYAIVTLR